MKTEIVIAYRDNGEEMQWVTFNGKTEIFNDRQQAIARGLKLSPNNCTIRVQGD